MLMSERFRTAFKIALAMTLAYGVALALDWDNPHWAGFSIAFCSMATAGESLLKGLLRIFGTFAAIFVSLPLVRCAVTAAYKSEPSGRMGRFGAPTWQNWGDVREFSRRESIAPNVGNFGAG